MTVQQQGGFLSTPSVGRATLRILRKELPHQKFLSTPSVGRATGLPGALATFAQFLSTPSVGRATAIAKVASPKNVISIHALRGEGDNTCRGTGMEPHDFYPRPPWGGRRFRNDCEYIVWDFYPRPPWGGRPEDPDALSVLRNISIHALRGEGDGMDFPCANSEMFISIHALRGEGDIGLAAQSVPLNISIHALRGEGDRTKQCITAARSYFYPRPPWGGRLAGALQALAGQIFLSTPSVGRATLWCQRDGH